MSDDEQPNPPGGEQPSGPREEQPTEPREQPSPGKPAGTSPAPPGGSASAAAARRARRIGGRPAGPAGAPRPEPAQPGEVAQTVYKRGEPAPAAGLDSDLGAPEPTTVVVTAVPAWLNWAPAAVLGAGAVTMAVLLIVFSHGVWWGGHGRATAGAPDAQIVRQQVLAAAKTCVATTNTYKYSDLDTYERKALACTTGEFTGQLRDTIERLIKVNAPKLKSSQTAQINQGGIEAITPNGNQWTILLFGQLSVTNANDAKPRTDPFAAQVRMDRVNGKWLIGALTTVSSPLS